MWIYTIWSMFFSTRKHGGGDIKIVNKITPKLDIIGENDKAGHHARKWSDAIRKGRSEISK
jgi:hypothetical protein